MSGTTYVLRLNAHGSLPAEQRELTSGSLTIGRDRSADWVIPDPERRLSRVHCRLDASSEDLVLTDLSSNGVMLNDANERVAPGVPITVAAGDQMRLGERRLTIATRLGPAAQVANAPHSETAILAAFCAGAGLDPSVFAARDLLDVMNHLGGIYCEMLVGLVALMQARATSRGDLSLDGTTLFTGENNPFKWAGAPSLAGDLLDARAIGYLNGARAVKASFDDLIAHHEALAAALPAAARLALEAVRPEKLEAEVARPLLPGAKGRAWNRFCATHAEATSERGIHHVTAAAYAPVAPL